MRRISLAVPLALLTQMLIPVTTPAAVLIELFTSQGCPNCPRAEEVMGRLDRDLGPEVVFLAFHVDIFDSPRFKDRFSRADWTRRQAMYARPRFDTSLSTPEAIVDGRTVLVGSDESGLRQAIAVAGREPAANVTLTRDPAASAVVRVVVDRVAAEESALDVMVAEFERGTTTPIRGLDRPLFNDFVVRSLRRLGRLETGQRLAEFRLDASSPGIAVFLQDRRTLAVRGVGALGR